MKMTAAGRDFMTVEHERNVVAAVVSTAGHVRNTLAAATAAAREHHGWIGFSEDDGKGASIRRPTASQRVEDNAFHLGYFAR